VEVCPVEALVFGTRGTLMDVAKARIETHPDRYYPEVYGQSEAGGTDWLYLASVPFDQIDFRTDLGTKAFVDYTKDIMKAVPVIMFIWAGVLYGVNLGKKQSKQGSEGTTQGERG
jgi:hypothetical protein